MKNSMFRSAWLMVLTIPVLMLLGCGEGNAPPKAEITRPQAGSTFCQDESITFKCTALDPDETLPDQAFAWTATSGAPPSTLSRDLGSGPMVTVDDLLPGEWQVTLIVTDSSRAEGQDSIEVKVLSSMDLACRDLPPSAQIKSPQDSKLFMTEGRDKQGKYATLTLTGAASDPEDADNTLLVEWFSSTDGKLGEGRQLTTRVHMTALCSQKITITLRVTDSDQNVAEDSIVIGLSYLC